MSLHYGELRPTSGWDRFVSLGHPSSFQRVSGLGSVTARHSSSERQRNFEALNRRRHLHSAGRPSRWALAHILAFFEMVNLTCIISYLFTAIFCQRTRDGVHYICLQDRTLGGSTLVSSRHWLTTVPGLLSFPWLRTPTSAVMIRFDVCGTAVRGKWISSGQVRALDSA